SLRAHVTALLQMKEQGTVVFEYGNNLRRQALAAGVENGTTIPGFVAEYVRPILSQGKGPFRWICLSGDPEDLRRTEEAILDEAGTPGMRRWFEMARSRVAPQGLPARICWLG